MFCARIVRQLLENSQIPRQPSLPSTPANVPFCRRAQYSRGNQGFERLRSSSAARSLSAPRLGSPYLRSSPGTSRRKSSSPVVLQIAPSLARPTPACFPPYHAIAPRPWPTRREAAMSREYIGRTRRARASGSQHPSRCYRHILLHGPLSSRHGLGFPSPSRRHRHRARGQVLHF